jgi:O-acetyl-ADP-ribose deacetylase (regulator of RNase III)
VIEFVNGNILEAPVSVWVNPVNCVGVMGAGLALEFKKRYPEMFYDYQGACAWRDLIPGGLHIWSNAKGVWIINLATKNHWRGKSRYEWIEGGLKRLRLYLQLANHTKIALPTLGCGCGGLDWANIKPIIVKYLEDIDVHTLVFGPKGP